MNNSKRRRLQKQAEKFQRNQEVARNRIMSNLRTVAYNQDVMSRRMAFKAGA